MRSLLVVAAASDRSVAARRRRRARDAARGSRSRRRRRRVVRVGRRLDARARGRRHDRRRPRPPGACSSRRSRVQPVTVIAVVAGASLGLRAGVATGAVAAFVSNLFLGQGIWTPQQMLGWAACGAAGALLAPAIRGRVPLAALCAVLGFAFSISMDLWLWYGFFPHTAASLAAVLAPRALVRRRACARQRRDRARDRARVTADARPLRDAPAHGGRVGLADAARRGGARRHAGAVRAGARRCGGLRRARRPARRAADLLGGARPARVAQRRSGLARLPAVAGGLAALDDRRGARRARRAVARRDADRAARPAARRAPRERADRRRRQLDLLGGARARPLDGGDDALAARAPVAVGRLVVGGRRPARLERHRRRARGAARRRCPRRAGDARRCAICSRSRTATAASS